MKKLTSKNEAKIQFSLKFPY